MTVVWEMHFEFPRELEAQLPAQPQRHHHQQQQRTNEPATTVPGGIWMTNGSHTVETSEARFAVKQNSSVDRDVTVSTPPAPVIVRPAPPALVPLPAMPVPFPSLTMENKKDPSRKVRLAFFLDERDARIGNFRERWNALDRPVKMIPQPRTTIGTPCSGSRYNVKIHTLFFMAFHGGSRRTAMNMDQNVITTGFGPIRQVIELGAERVNGTNEIQIVKLVSRGKRLPRLEKPPLSDEEWKLIKRCWVKEAYIRVTRMPIQTKLVKHNFVLGRRYVSFNIWEASNSADTDCSVQGSYAPCIYFCDGSFPVRSEAAGLVRVISESSGSGNLEVVDLETSPSLEGVDRPHVHVLLQDTIPETWWKYAQCERQQRKQATSGEAIQGPVLRNSDSFLLQFPAIRRVQTRSGSKARTKVNTRESTSAIPRRSA
ncbi:hypothetical protein F5887DRAFT_1162311 [Amanita rubescens]|nr:hypothetical protein F5887DRAFT_1162311 [Amanita rubescens]